MKPSHERFELDPEVERQFEEIVAEIRRSDLRRRYRPTIVHYQHRWWHALRHRFGYE